MNRRTVPASIFAFIAAMDATIRGTKAQATVTNSNGQIVSTGDVTINQTGQASQDIDYRPITGGKGCESGAVRYDFGYRQLVVCNEQCEWRLLDLETILPCRRGHCGR